MTRNFRGKLLWEIQMMSVCGATWYNFVPKVTLGFTCFRATCVADLSLSSYFFFFFFKNEHIFTAR